MATGTRGEDWPLDEDRDTGGPRSLPLVVGMDRAGLTTLREEHLSAQGRCPEPPTVPPQLSTSVKSLVADFICCPQPEGHC